MVLQNEDYRMKYIQNYDVVRDKYQIMNNAPFLYKIKQVVDDGSSVVSTRNHKRRSNSKTKSNIDKYSSKHGTNRGNMTMNSRVNIKIHSGQCTLTNNMKSATLKNKG